MDSSDPATTRFRYKWKDDNDRAFTTGVSLHGHTWNSHENLAFLPGTIKKTYILPYLLHRVEDNHRKAWKKELNYNLGYWTSPISPEAAYAIEAGQIKVEGLVPLVSLTDHDETASCKDIVSLEWSAPYKSTIFHIGVHNLPHPQAPRILNMLREITRQPSKTDPLSTTLKEIGAMPGTLIVLNHPLVDQGRIGHKVHLPMVREFLSQHRRWIHALEINALQPWSVNRRVIKLAGEVNLPLISGGDRHGFEPNGAINLTNATTFAAFAHEIREDKKSEVLFMPQFREPLALRYSRNIQAIMAEYPELAGRSHWYDRVFYKCPDGITRSLGEMARKDDKLIKATNWIVGTIGFANRLTKSLAPIFSRTKADSITSVRHELYNYLTSR